MTLVLGFSWISGARNAFYSPLSLKTNVKDVYIEYSLSEAFPLTANLKKRGFGGGGGGWGVRETRNFSNTFVFACRRVALLSDGISFELVSTRPRTSLRKSLLLKSDFFFIKTWARGSMRLLTLTLLLLFIPQVTYTRTKNKGGLHMFIFNFSPLSQRNALKNT